MDDSELPKALVKRIVKSKLVPETGDAGKDGEQKDVQINKDTLLALSESAKIFINYITATANDVCKEYKRQIISVEDVLSALEDLEFPHFVPPLKDALAGELMQLRKHSLHSCCPPNPRMSYHAAFKAESKEKNKKKAEQTKKRKLEAQADQLQLQQPGAAAAPPGLAGSPAVAVHQMPYTTASAGPVSSEAPTTAAVLAAAQPAEPNGPAISIVPGVAQAAHFAVQQNQQQPGVNEGT